MKTGKLTAPNCPKCGQYMDKIEAWVCVKCGKVEDKSNRGEEMSDWSWGSIIAIIIGVILLVLLVLAVFPLAAFWAIQVLFNYGIPYNSYTVIAFWILFILMRPSVTVNK